MSDASPYTNAELMKAVRGVIRALSVETGTLNVAASLDAIAFVAAIIYDLDPTITAPLHRRKAAEQQAASVLTYLKHLRGYYEETGTRFGEALGGTVAINPRLMAEMTKGSTAQ